MKGKEQALDDDLHRMAVQAIMYRKAMNKKRLEFKDLIGKRGGSPMTSRADQDKKKETFEDLESRLGVPG